MWPASPLKSHPYWHYTILVRRLVDTKWLCCKGNRERKEYSDSTVCSRGKLPPQRSPFSLNHSWFPNIDRYTPNIWPWPWPLTTNLNQGKWQSPFLAFDLYPWPMTLIFIAYLVRVKVKIKVKGQTFQLGEHKETDRWTNGRTDKLLDEKTDPTKYIFSLLLGP